MNTLVFDIETGPLPWEQIAPFYTPPPAMAPWDESMVKYGQTKDPAKRAEKLATVKAAYEAELAAEAATRDAHKCEWASRAALSALTGRVLAIGIQKGDDYAVIGEDGEPEKEILKSFWQIYLKYNLGNGRLIGWNSNWFDVPFLVRRSWLNFVSVPESVFDSGGRYLSKTFLDLMQVWGCTSREMFSLDNAAKFFSCGGKPEGIDGGHFAALWLSGDPASRQIAADYLHNDLAMTWKLAERMGVIL